jgi:hypothetical protein
MTMINIVQARALAAATTAAADEAMQKGQHEFELRTVVQALDAATRDELQKALEVADAQ